LPCGSKDKKLQKGCFKQFIIHLSNYYACKQSEAEEQLYKVVTEQGQPLTTPWHSMTHWPLHDTVLKTLDCQWQESSQTA